MILKKIIYKNIIFDLVSFIVNMGYVDFTWAVLLCKFKCNLKKNISCASLKAEVRCVKGLSLWRNNSIEINNEIFKGYRQGNHEEIINEVVAGYSTSLINYHLSLCLQCNFRSTPFISFYVFVGLLAYDLLDTDRNNFNVTIWYNSSTTYNGDLRDRRVKYVRVPRSVNLVRN